MKFILFSTLVLFSVPDLWAQINVTQALRASSVTEDDNGNVTKIFGGIAGDTTTYNCAALGASTFCDTCGNKDEACNRLRIHSGMQLRLDVAVTEDISGDVCVGLEKDGDYDQIVPISAPATLSQGQTGTIDIAWSDICLDASTDGSCNALGGTTDIIIGLDSGGCSATKPDDFETIPVVVAIPNSDGAAGVRAYNLVQCDDASPSTGVCNFLAYPGDEKVFIDQVQEVGAWPLSNEVKVKALRIFYNTTSFNDANYDSSTYVDIELDSSGVLVTDLVEGLTNEVAHFFRPAIVDEANNIAFLLDEAEIDGGGFIGGAGCVADTDLNCDLIATPSKVIGLLSEDLNCFVSTAAFGSSLSVEVHEFRRFRNRYMLTNEKGRYLNRLYYKYGPYMARFISEHSYLKPVARTVLRPMAFLAKQSNRHGLYIFYLGLLGFGIMFGGMIFGGRRLWQKFS